MGDVRAGQMLFDETGRPTIVTKLFEIETQATGYRLGFDDGSHLDAGDEHLWRTFDASELAALTRHDSDWRARRRSRRPSRAVAGASGPGAGRGKAAKPGLAARNRAFPPPALLPPQGTIRTTAHIAATLQTAKGRTNHAIRVAGALELPVVDLPLDPYVLGVWLGDGTSASGQVTTADPAIVESLRVAGFAPRKSAARYGWGTRGLSPVLRRLGLLGDKHIPSPYLRASRAQRAALLQGLMDTDGTATQSGSVEITLTRKKLIDGVVELVTSLGHKASLRTGTARLNGRDCGPKYRLKWQPQETVFRLPRKFARQRLAVRRTTRFRYVVTAQRLSPRPMRCLTVAAPSGLFLAGNAMIPTHNSSALLAAALQYADAPRYAALILRRTFPSLAMPGGLLERSHEWLDGTAARWSPSTSRWHFPSGATLTFGFLDDDRDLDRYASAEFHCICFDELTQFPEHRYRRMLARLRRLKDAEFPLRSRGASNPGGVGHDWVKAWFVRYTGPDRAFVPATLEDNPYLDRLEYERQLALLDPVTREQLRRGNWDVTLQGGLFPRTSWEFTDVPPAGDLQRVRFWDLAGTKPKAGSDPSHTCGLKMALHADGRVIIEDVRRIREGPAEVDAFLKTTAELDGRAIPVRLEQEGGSSGKRTVSDVVRRVLQGFDAGGVMPWASKVERARPFSAQVSVRNVYLLRADWNAEYVAEREQFPLGSHDDQVDASSGAFDFLVRRGRAASEYYSGVGAPARAPDQGDPWWEDDQMQRADE